MSVGAKQEQVWTCADGTRIRGETQGAAHDPTVILAHGGGQSRRSWSRVAPGLAERGFRVISYDMRGHGKSDWARDERYDEADLVSDLEAIVSETGAVEPILVGASAGGIACLAAIGTGKIRAAGLCLIDIAARTEKAGYDRIRNFMTAGKNGFSSLVEAAAALATYRGEPRPKNPIGLEKALRQGKDGRFYWHWDPAFLAVRHRDIDQREARLTQYLALLECPLRLVRGANSDMVSPEGARALLDACPHASFVDVAGVGHMVAADRNDAFAAALGGFLEAVRDQTARRRNDPVR